LKNVGKEVNCLDWREEAYKLSLKGYNSREIATMLGTDQEKTRNAIKKRRKKYGTVRVNRGQKTTDSIPTNVTTTTKSKFTYSNDICTYEDEFISADGKEITVDKALELKGLNKEEWEVTSFVVNTWQSGDQNKYQFKLSVRPKKDTEITFADIDEFFENKTFKNTPPQINTKYNKYGEILEIDIADLHCGLLAWRAETGKDEDLHITAERFLSGIDEIVSRNINKDIKEIYLCALGDIIHIDNDNNTTTKGTPQQADGRIAKIFDFAFDTMNEALNKLRVLNAEIHYIYLCGNHDRNTGYYLVKTLQLANKDICFDISPNPQKAIHFGNILVGLSHGDMQKKNKGTWLLNDYRKEFGESEFVEEHCGHLHTEGLQYINGVLCRNVLAQCGNSFWEHKEAYRSLRGIMSFVWDEQKGLKSTQYVYF